MVSARERVGWALVFGTILAFTVPWFLWGNRQVIAGLPVWLWWHIGWMILAAVVFRLFAQRAWGLGITETPDPGSSRGDGP